MKILNKASRKNLEAVPAGGTRYLSSDCYEIYRTAVLGQSGVNRVLTGFHLEGSIETFTRIDGGTDGQKLLYIRSSLNDANAIFDHEIGS